MDILHKIGRPKIVARCRVGPKSFLSRNEWAAPPKIEVLNIPRQDIDPISSFGISRWDYFGKQYLCIFWRYLDSFQTSQEYPCRDSSTAEYNVCALIMFKKNMAPPSEVAPFSKYNKIHGIFLLFFSFLRHEPTSIFCFFIFLFQTSQEYPCRDPSIAEYNVCALIMFRKNMAPPSEVAPFSKTAPCRGGAVLLNLPKKVKVVLFWLHPWHHFDSTPGTVGLSKG